MEISKYEKSMVHLNIKPLTFSHTVDVICYKFGEFYDISKLITLSATIKEASTKLYMTTKEQYKSKNLWKEAIKIVHSIHQVEKVITKFLMEDIKCDDFILDLQKIVDIELKNVNTSLEVINNTI